MFSFLADSPPEIGDELPAAAEQNQSQSVREQLSKIASLARDFLGDPNTGLFTQGCSAVKKYIAPKLHPCHRNDTLYEVPLEAMIFANVVLSKFAGARVDQVRMSVLQSFQNMYPLQRGRVPSLLELSDKFIEKKALTKSRLSRYNEAVGTILVEIYDACESTEMACSRLAKRQRRSEAIQDAQSRDIQNIFDYINRAGDTGSAPVLERELIPGTGSWGQAYLDGHQATKDAILFSVKCGVVTQREFTSSDTTSEQDVRDCIAIGQYMLQNGATPSPSAAKIFKDLYAELFASRQPVT